MQQRRALGRGLESLIPKTVDVSPPPQADVDKEGQSTSGAIHVSVDAISPNRHQPRQVFDEERIRDLASSIQQRGVLQPLIVTRSSSGRYELVAGERRLRAARLIGLSEVPVIIKDVDEEGLLALALIENIQREDLCCIEEARALRELTEQFNYSQDEAADRVGKSRSHVANSLRLLKLPQTIQDDLSAGRYSAGHARALLGLPNSHEQLKMRDQMLKQLPSVRDIERMVEERRGGGVSTKKAKKNASLPPQVAMIVGEMVQALGTKVRLKMRSNGTGQVIIDYYSAQDLDRVYRKVVA